MRKKVGESTYFTMFIGVVMLIAAIDTISSMSSTIISLSFIGGIYPAVVASILFILTVIQVIHDFRKGQTTSGALDIEKADTTLKVRYQKASRPFFWLMGLYLAILLLGFKLGALAFLLGYLIFEGKGRWLKIVLICAGMYLLLYFFGRFLSVWWPVGLLGELLKESVPWIF